ncbi:MAG: hypothetical protein EOS73_05050 [Mesorhizobium sp.]|uniref:hypothetical protein n=1 Tax=unclassified Mesorhizobium TaxID=325217 RepID=UPI000FCB6409|nr:MULTISPECIES: hypothetical protein [unclassified Mesorhizobium]RUU23784.1 hypothetical protein EOC94_33805 [Mesorhizobium sp. M6A.T.Ce.TU.016.01.1.1]RUU87588.1 hypothetical protein EOB59_25175 [Mesorhizobium sp. M7A.F.Ca.MR.176.00.0.0]RVD12043.1 hypothetical protein EN749_29185 [Mesorhizobium sp. M7A.F.Ca.ET.027.02.1.1]RWD12025.1 MAG: hypothetical protein EOS73_05050 [Mesorhizobium sp.]
MIQLLSIFGDVMRIATFQWRDRRQHEKRYEEPTSRARWASSPDRQPFRRSARDD